MKGYGLSVFAGTKIERFGVEVIGISRNMNPQQDVVLISTNGMNLEHTGSVAGMSGSPIYLTDEQGRTRMLGAYAYGWPLAKDPIAGVQPIEYMLQINTARSSTLDDARAAVPASGMAATSTTVTPTARTISTWSAEAWRRQVDDMVHGPVRPAVSEGGNSLAKLSTPVMVSGVPDSVMELIAPMFARYGAMLVSAGSGSGGGIAQAFPESNTAPNMQPVEFAPGGAMVVPVMTGDVGFTALGTITEVIGDRVFGFGHPMFSEGAVELPLGGGYVNLVIPRITNSFKMGGMTSLAGTLHSDEQSGVAGLLGKAPTMIPIEVHVHYADGSLDRTYRFNAIRHPQMTGAMAGAALMLSAGSVKQLPENALISHEVEYQFSGDRKVNLSNIVPTDQQSILMMDAMGPIAAAMVNPFERIKLEKMTARITITSNSYPSEVRRVLTDRSTYKPGETVRLSTIVREHLGSERVVAMELKLPADLPEGSHDIEVSDADEYVLAEMSRRPDLFMATNGDDVLKVVQRAVGPKRDQLFATIELPGSGISVGRMGLQHMPGSKRQVLLRQAKPDVGQTTYAASTSTSAGAFVRGGARITITVKR